MGFRSLDEIIGRVDLLKPRELALPKAARLDLSAILRDADPSGTRARRSQRRRNDRPEDTPPLDEIIYQEAVSVIHDPRPYRKRYTITNRERSVGARLSGEVARIYGEAGLPPGTVQLHFTGVAGQAFGAFNGAGVQLTLEGEAQDYVGKGMAGGEIVVKPPAASRLTPHDNTIIGNTVLYGATGGALYASGRAGERLAVRNSGARAVVEGCGDHGCEYMTGGVVVVLGRTGRNFGAGMSGGVAYVYDPDGTFEGRLNPGMVALGRLTSGLDEELLRTLVSRHVALTGSPLGAELLGRWEEARDRFWKVTPTAEAADVHGVAAGALEALRQEAQVSSVAL
jgi:glutamate synthase (ferredoxin)